MDVPLGPKCPLCRNEPVTRELGYQFGQETHLQPLKKKLLASARAAYWRAFQTGGYVALLRIRTGKATKQERARRYKATG